MARKTKPVDRTPICDPAYLRRIDPLWMPGPVPFRFWLDETHRRDYLLWSGHRSGFRTMEDFYRLDFEVVFKRDFGAGLSVYWGQSAFGAVQDCFPEYDWKPWLFAKAPQGFWDLPANQRSYMDWLGQRLGYRCADDWYAVTLDDFLRNKGRGIMALYHRSPVLAVIDLIPAQDWCEWKFRRVPPGFWEVAKNRQRYLRWLGKELGFRQPDDWYQIRTEDFARRRGGALLERYSSFYDLMREFLPQLDWNQFEKNPPMRVEEVLVWVDAYHARHGKWPTCRSGVIPGTRRTWGSIDAWLRYGSSGLPGRTSLAKLLAKHRGVPVGKKPRALSIKQILAWTDAYFAVHGNWPTRGSGQIPGTRETWNRIADALRAGYRGLRRGSSLAQLLARRRGARNHTRLPPLEEL